MVAIGDPLADGPVDEAQAVGSVRVTPVSVDRAGEVLAVADRAARIPVEDREACVREGDHLQPGGRPVREVRAAVDVQNEAAAAASSGTHEPGVQVVTVPVSDRMALGLASKFRFWNLSVDHHLKDLTWVQLA